jgi:hypothetical protein
MTNTKNFIPWAVSVLFLAGIITLFAVSGGDGASRRIASAGVLNSIESSFDFSTIRMEDGDVSHAFVLTNEGEEPVLIEKVYTSCMCTSTYITDSRGRKYGAFSMPGHGGYPKTRIDVLPGESVSGDAVFDPAAHGPSGVGLVQRSIYLETDSKESPKIELNFTAMVIR